MSVTVSKRKPTKYFFKRPSIGLNFLLSLVAFSIAPLGAQSAEGQFWLSGFQKYPANQILEQAIPNEKQKGEQAAVLFRQGVFAYQDDGSLISTTRIVYKILNPEGVKNWSSLQVAYSPWHEEKPVVQVRITNPDGAQTWVKTPDLLEVSGSADSSNLYSDQKILKGPFPQVKEGSVVEQEITTHTKPLLPGSGQMRYWSFSSSVPEFRNYLTISVPQGQPLFWLPTELPGFEPVVAKENGRTIYQFNREENLAFTLGESNLLPDDLQWPAVLFTTSKDWKTLAELYSATVETQLAGQPLTVPSGLIVQSGTPWEKARRYLHWIDGKVRYTGLELGINSIVPVPPQTVLDRGYGDCKDKALLLTLLLRKSGVPAYLALIKTGPGQDIDPRVPGMDHFNHAIVYVDGPEPFFVDPTVEYNREGRIPYWDQNRWTLVAKPGLVAPVRTPLAKSEENLAVVSKSITLGDEGLSLVEETQTYYGDYEIFYRNRFAGETPERQVKRLQDYAKANLNGTLVDSKVTPSEDLSRPFTSAVQVKNSSLGYTEGSSSTWELNWAEIKSWLPETFFTEDKEPRKKFFQLALPFKAQWSYEIIPPKGFALRAQPSLVQEKWGPFSLNGRYTTDQKGQVKVTVEVDSGKSIYSPEEYEAVKKGLSSYFAAPKSVKVIFDHRASLLFQAGNYKEGFDAFKALVAEEPQKAIHHIRLSVALLDLGLGDQAHLSAKTAVDLEPKNDKAWANLGWSLEFNSLGRRFGKGWDREGALAAFKKAAQLNPEAWYHRANLAILLEIDPTGFRYGAHPDLVAARKEYESLEKFLGNGGLWANYLQILFLQKDEKALVAGAGKADRDSKNIYRYLGATLSQNVTESLKALEPQLSPQERSRILTLAAERLIQVREYEKAALTLREASKGSEDGVKLEYRADNLAQTKAITFQTKDLSTPEKALQMYLVGQGQGDGVSFVQLKDLTTPAFYRWGIKDPVSLFYGDWSSLARAAINLGILPEVMSDLTLSQMDREVQGDKNVGAHISLRTQGNGPWEGYFLLFGKDGWRVAADQRSPGLVSAQVMDFIAAGNEEAAGLWLDWYWEDQVEPRDVGVFNQPLKPFWRSGNPRETKAMVLAAQVLGALNPESEAPLLALKKLLKVNKNTEIDKGIRMTLSEGYQILKKPDQVALTLEPLIKDNPREASLTAQYFEALRQSGQRERAKREIDSLMAKYPRDENLLRRGLYLAVTGLDFSAIDQILKTYNPRLEANDYNNLAWMYVFKQPVPEQALVWARKAVTLTNGRARAVLHTLATLYGESGRFDDARKLLDQGMALGQDLDPINEDWYVLGRVAEGYGFLESAKSAYERVQPTEDKSDLSDIYVLAQKRLKLLGQIPGNRP